MGGRPADAVRALARATLTARAKDVTTPVTGRTCVVVAPHCDDETFGCGATIARKAAAGTDVLVVAVSDSSRSHTSPQIDPAELARIRRGELAQALSRLGSRIRVEYLDFPDGELARHVSGIADRLTDIVRREQPQEIYGPDLREPPEDHSSVARATRQAWAATDGRALLLEYPIWMWSWWPWAPGVSVPGRLLQPIPAVFGPAVVKVSTARFLDRKQKAVDAYLTQTTQFRGIPGWEPLSPAFRARFGGPYELFFPVRPAAGAREVRAAGD